MSKSSKATKETLKTKANNLRARFLSIKNDESLPNLEKRRRSFVVLKSIQRTIDLYIDIMEAQNNQELPVVLAKTDAGVEHVGRLLSIDGGVAFIQSITGERFTCSAYLGYTEMVPDRKHKEFFDQFYADLRNGAQIGLYF